MQSAHKRCYNKQKSARARRENEGRAGMRVEGSFDVAKRLLLVDDEPAIIKGLKFSLEQDGYEILTASDGGEAWT